MTPTGEILDDGATLVLRRTFRSPIEDVWASCTESERLGRWYGTFTGDPSTGHVMLTMNADAEEMPPVRFHIDECEPPQLLTVRATDDYGTWLITAELAEDDGTTTLEFRQRELDPAMAHMVGPGWEWYLDRLVAAVVGAEPPTLDDFETVYMATGEAYRAMVTARQRDGSRRHPST